MAQNIGNHFITNHRDHVSMNTFNSNLKSGDINPLLRKSVKKILNINTRFRDNYSTTESTNFGIILPESIKKVVSMKLISCEVPQTVYTISEKLGSNTFKIAYGSNRSDISNVITIPSGAYTGKQLETKITNELSSQFYSDITLSYGTQDGLMTFNSSNHTQFSLDFNYYKQDSKHDCQYISSNINKEQLTLGWLLGFRGNYAFTNKYKVSSGLVPNKGGPYKNSNIKLINTQAKTKMYCSNYNKQINDTNSTCYKEYVKNESNLNDLSNNIYVGDISYSGDSLYDEMGNRYFMLSINDYQNNHNNIFMSPYQQSLADNNVIAKVSASCCNKPIVDHPERTYFGPTDISKLHIILYDECGRIVDINNSDYSFTLEFEVLYDL